VRGLEVLIPGRPRTEGGTGRRVGARRHMWIVVVRRHASAASSASLERRARRRCCSGTTAGACPREPCRPLTSWSTTTAAYTTAAIGGQQPSAAGVQPRRPL